MAAITLGAPQPWPPPPPPATYCQPGICTTTCRQFCNYFYIQPPPTIPLINNSDSDSESDSSKSISPLMAALIAVLAASFLILFYYTVVSRYCRRRRRNRRGAIRSVDSNRIDPMIHDPTRPDTGLDESYIRQITVFKYRSSDGLVDGNECAVCLTEFKEEESLRLMPNCEHAFHIPCIDTWLATHSSCPLCRSGMNPLPARGGGGDGGGENVSVAALRVERSSDDRVLVENRGETVVVQVVVVDDVDDGEKEVIR